MNRLNFWRCFSFAAGLAAFGWQSAQAQYYYRDLYGNQQLTKSLAKYKENKVRKIKVKSIEPDGTESEGFFCEKSISRDYEKMETFTRSDLAPSSLLTTYFFPDGRVKLVVDSSRTNVNTTIYEYDAKQRIASINTHMRSDDDDFKSEIYEQHIYSYDLEGQLKQMQKVIGRDTVLILFANEDGHVATEMNTKENSYYFYYYDAKGRLTDVVISNDLRPRPVPEYIFKYSANGEVTQMTATEEGMKDFTVWRYTYDNGLPISEKCYANGKKLLGAVEYEYK